MEETCARKRHLERKHFFGRRKRISDVQMENGPYTYTHTHIDKYVKDSV
jgi:hypothetical protein